MGEFFRFVSYTNERTYRYFFSNKIFIINLAELLLLWLLFFCLFNKQQQHVDREKQQQKHKVTLLILLYFLYKILLINFQLRLSLS